MSILRTRSGGHINLLDPDPDVINIEDIARSLSNTCRFNGQCDFYSVAEHSVLAARIADDIGLPDVAIFGALMHDAAEAYVGDVCTPLKKLLPDYQEIEAKVDLAVRIKFDLDHAHDAIVKQIDQTLYENECPQLFAQEANDDYLFPLEFWSPEEAEEEFLKAFERYQPFHCECSFDTCDFPRVCKKLGMCRYKYHEEVVNGKNRI
jgi:5'-deoxynucleotidase YfbR-like HD superfamily hydrolase